MANLLNRKLLLPRNYQDIDNYSYNSYSNDPNDNYSLVLSDYASGDYTPPEKPCTDLDALLARHANWEVTDFSLDATMHVYSPIRGPSMKTKWATERNVPLGVTMGLFSPVLQVPKASSALGRGENHWVQPDDDDDSSEEEMDDVDVVLAPEVVATCQLDEYEYEAMDWDMDDAPPSDIPESSGCDQMGEDQPRPYMHLPMSKEGPDLTEVPYMLPSATSPGHPFSPVTLGDEEMIDVDDILYFNNGFLRADDTPSTSPSIGDTPWAASSHETSLFSSTSFTASDLRLAAIFCPPRLIDVADAWDFIEHVAQNPTAPFHPQVLKIDTRKGIRSGGKKHPIGELLMKALKQRWSSPSTPLSNQDLLPFCQMTSIAPPHNVAVDRYLGSKVELTLTECMAYFTNHYCQRPLLVRFVRAGLNGGSIANEINMARQLSGDAAFPHNRPWTRLRRANPAVPVPDPTGAKTKDFTARQWKTPKTGIDYPLLALEHGLPQLPRGNDAGPLTHLIKWCKANSHFRVMISDVHALLKHAGISPTIAKPRNGGCPDRAAVERHRDRVVEDRTRVLTTRAPG